MDRWAARETTWFTLVGTIALTGFLCLACSGENGSATTSSGFSDRENLAGEERETGQLNQLGEDSGQVELPYACHDEKPCSDGRACYSGVCLEEPISGIEGTLSDPTGYDPKPVEDVPQLGCVEEEVGSPAGPETATLYGAVTRFGSGRKTFGVQVDFFLASEWDPSACEYMEFEDERFDCYANYGTADNSGGPQPVGSALSFQAEALGNAQETCNGHQDCPLGYECLQGDLDKYCEEQFGLYVIPSVPTNTPLVLRARATEDLEKWHDVFTFNVSLPADQVDENGRILYNATMVSHGQWLLTANSVSLAEIPLSNGAVGGRIRDCGIDGERDSWPITGVSLGSAGPAGRIVYFNNLEDDTVPLVARTVTNTLGRYAALDIEAGWNMVSGAVQLGDSIESVGSVEVYVVPNALSIVGWPGTRPHWKQEWLGDFP